MFFESILREDRSVIDLLNADYTFVERAASPCNMAFRTSTAANSAA